ncbi:Pim proto-oncogene, serine/threonine kinase, related 110 precursor [Danio rerio]|uniref:non-specific serine/threonine protein kinase n=1 Tax=Danio rerio TaxID=7955 RepID=A4QP28_DANRE|nr:Pim proto-oncogene, serine/threonine kinase, related 110 precursor [Danio rerio]AAI39631.1 Si:ch211-215m21.17 protein [Danio rerio]|eukprot:NP_001082859.1 Pim proto-oncogene, serine/threonine kinase, related 110 precursor [Danio rerio]
MLFTVLGLIALFLGERNTNATVGVEVQEEDQHDVPPLRSSDGQEIDACCKEPLLVEPVSVHSEEPSLVEPDSVHSEQPSLVEPVSVHNEEPSLVEPVSVHSEEPSLVEFVSVHSEQPSLVESVSVHSEQPSLVEPDSVHSEQPSLVEPDSVRSEQPSLVEPDSVHSEQTSLVEPDSVHSEEPSLVEPVSVHSEQPSLVEPVSVHSEQPSLVEPVSDDPSFDFSDEPGSHAVEDPTCQTEDKETQIIEINSQGYEIGAELDKGGCGTVYEGSRLEDGLQVAVKVSNFKKKQLISVDGFDEPLPLEIALHFLANKGPKVKEIIELLDWKVEADHYFMVLERPIPCVSLFDFLSKHRGILPEDKLRKIMLQTIIAAQTCCQRGVLHRDIKLENLLINPDTLEVKLIDFGCGDLLTEDIYKEFRGTREFAPPEFWRIGRYRGEPATVWSLGVVLFLMIFCRYPGKADLPKVNNKHIPINGLSKECCDFFHGCLQLNQMDRLNLQKLNSHEWFKELNTF